MRLLLLAWLMTSSGVSADAPPDCPAAREFVGALEYLRDHPKFQLPETESLRMAEKVASGCRGAALRFIRVTDLLVAGELGARDAVATGLELARRTDREAETFRLVFRTALSRDGLDLDLRSSLAMARQLTTQFDGEAATVRDDFERLLRFCAHSEGLDLPKPGCGNFAARLAAAGEPHGGGISRPFIELYEFLVSSKGPALTTRDALRKAGELVESGGRESASNFMTAYRYAAAEKGLNLNRNDAVAFAGRLAAKAAPPGETPTETARSKPAPGSVDRLPASRKARR